MSDSSDERARRLAESREFRKLLQARIDELEEWNREERARRERRRRLLRRLIPLRRA
jgi:hypothetical protein